MTSTATKPALSDAVLGLLDPIIAPQEDRERYARALRHFATVAENTGHPAQAARYRARADVLTA